MRFAAATLAATLCHAQWLRIDSPGLELFTDQGEKSGRRIAARFEQIHEIFQRMRMTESPLRLRVFAFSSPEEFHKYRPDSAGFYQPAADRDYIALYNGPEAGRVAFHEYIHLVIRHSGVPIPKWFDEGTSEFLSTIEIGKDRLRIGEPIPAHVATLADQSWLPASSLTGSATGSLFYAESWALARLLHLDPAWRESLPRFLALLSADRPAPDAFREAFGKTLDDAIAAARVHLSRCLRCTTAAPFAAHLPQQAAVTPLTAEESAVARATFALALRRPELAAGLIANLPDSAASEQLRGSIALSGNRRDEARRHLDRAAALGSRDASLYFEYAMLEHESGRPDSPMLRKVLELDPDFSDAAFLLGVRETDDGLLPEAIAHLRTAVRGRPDRSTYWNALAYAQSQARDFEASRASARRALHSAESETERSAAEALMNGDRPAAEHVPSRPSVITPDSWTPRASDSHLDGTLIHFDCSGPHPRIRIRSTSGAVVELAIQHPAEVELVHSAQSTLQIACGPHNLPVAIDFDSTSKNVTRIDFRL